MPSVKRPASLAPGSLGREQAVKAKSDEHDTDAEPQTVRRGPAQELGAERHADHRADQKRRKPGRTDRVPQFPDPPALHDQAEGRDENDRLCRRQEVQPYRRRDDRKRETGEPRDKGGGKSGGNKQDQVDGGKFAHHAPHQRRRERRGGDRATLGLLQLGVVAGDLNTIVVETGKSVKRRAAKPNFALFRTQAIDII